MAARFPATAFNCHMIRCSGSGLNNPASVSSSSMARSASATCICNMGWELRSDCDIAGLKFQFAPCAFSPLFREAIIFIADRDIRYRHGHELAEPSPARIFFINICPPRVNVSGSTPLGPGRDTYHALKSFSIYPLRSGKPRRVNSRLHTQSNEFEGCAVEPENKTAKNDK